MTDFSHIPHDVFPMITNLSIGQQVKLKPYKTKEEANTEAKNYHKYAVEFLTQLHVSAKAGVLFEVVMASMLGMPPRIQQVNGGLSYHWPVAQIWLYPADWVPSDSLLRQDQQCACIINMNQGCICNAFTEEMKGTGRVWDAYLRTWVKR